MTERRFDDSFWGSKFVQSLEKDAKLLHLYCWTNKQCNPAGLYEITLRTITFDTGIEEADLPHLFELLQDKIVWYPDSDMVWVKNFIKRQTGGGKFLQAVAKSLIKMHNNGAVQALLNYNLERFNIEIPYQYYIDRILIPSTSNLPFNSKLIKNKDTDKLSSDKGGIDTLPVPYNKEYLIREKFKEFKEEHGRWPAGEEDTRIREEVDKELAESRG